LPTPSTGLRSLLLNGTTAFAETTANPPTSDSLNPSGSWSFELWIKDDDANGFDHPYRYILNKGDGIAAEAPYYLLLGNGDLLAGTRAAGVNHPLTYSLRTNGYSPKLWLHVAVTFDAPSTTLRLYLNGALVAQQALGARGRANTLPQEKGRQGPVQAKYFHGKIDDLRIWSTVRTPGEVQSNFRTQLNQTSPTTGLIANWHFDELPGATTAADLETQNDATLGGGATFSPSVHP
jgi:hypothetical protein